MFHHTGTLTPESTDLNGHMEIVTLGMQENEPYMEMEKKHVKER